MSLDYLCDLYELEKLREEYRVRPDSVATYTADRIATKILMGDPSYHHSPYHTHPGGWLGEWQLKRIQRIERPASPEHFSRLEMIPGAIRDTYFLSGGYKPPYGYRGVQCPVVGCENTQKANGLCNLHNTSKTNHPHLWCKVRGCGSREIRVKSLGLCNAHYLKFLRYGDPEHSERYRNQPKPLCSIEGCERTSHSKSWCKKHYSRWQRTGNPLGREGARVKERVA